MSSLQSVIFICKASIANLIIKQCSLDSIYPRYPESLLLHLQEGNNNLSGCYNSGPQPKNSRFQALAVHRFTSYRLLRVCKCIASHTCHRITSLPTGFGQCFFAALLTLNSFLRPYNPIATSSSCSLHEMSRQLLLDIQLSWFILGSPLTSSNY